MEKIPNMENVFRILSLLEKDVFQETSLHQISQRIDLDYKTIRKTVQQLLAESILIKEVKGKAHFISLNLNHSDIKTYLSFASYYNRRTYFQKSAQLSYLLEEVKKLNLQDSSLVLFGSHVLNKQTKSSDVDLLLITNSKTAPTKIKSLLLNYDIKTDLNILTVKQYQKALFSRGFNLVNQVLNKHIILKNPELYWELTLRGLKNGNRY
jgi:predicted nucleotidyltransferase